jgi:hypothetical protein
LHGTCPTSKGKGEIMSEYNKVCGAAFEDLTQEEMMDYDGGWTPLTLLSASSPVCLGSAAVSFIVTVTIFRP